MKNLTEEQQENLIAILKARFMKNMVRHPNIKWEDVEARLRKNEDKLWSLNEMEISGGEVDVIEYESQSDTFVFYDCAKESPLGRRSYCYDDEALQSRKENKPANSVVNLANMWGCELLDESAYRKLQEFGPFDLKTSSWLKTPDKIRKLGGAIFGDYRYEQVFIYHNGAESYYSARGFRCLLKV
jgi:hypothetical protein